MRSLPIWVLIALLAAGCAAPIREPVPEAEPGPPGTAPEPGQPETAPEPSQPESYPAVAALSSDARQAFDNGRFDEAAQALERAIRIDPQNGDLWHELARVRFEQGDYEQARQLAARSNALLDPGSPLKARNDELIQAARNALEY